MIRIITTCCNQILTTILLISGGFIVAEISCAADWPMYRGDAGRRGVTTDRVPNELTLAWVRQLPKLTPAFHDSRLQFDLGYEPVVSQGILLVASSTTDSVKAYDARSGQEIWSFYTNGPVRLAPVISESRACFGSDDGYLYCVELATGKLLWKLQAVPSQRRLLGNRRLISVWPVRGGPVVADGVVYFAAGVWPFEGVFVYALEMATGKVIWRNDRLGYRYGQQPHNTQAIGGLAPQGYLLVKGDELVVPCSNAYPATLNRLTGELINFELPNAGRYPGGWFAALDPEEARALRRGELTFDEAVNQQEHEDGPRKSRGGVVGLSREIRAADRILKFDEQLDGVDGVIHSLAVADDALFVTTRDGSLLCFRESEHQQELDPIEKPLRQEKPLQGASDPQVWETTKTNLSISGSSAAVAEEIVGQATSEFGIAIVVGLSDGELTKALIDSSQFHVTIIEDDPERVEVMRRALDDAGLYGRRAAVIHASDIREIELPPYIATLLLTERQDVALQPLHQTLRPFGGIAVGGERFVESPAGAELGTFASSSRGVAGLSMVRREGPLPGAAEYQGDFAASPDGLVRFPLGVLWFDDSLAHFKRSPQPVFDRGVMISRPKNWQVPRSTESNKVDYPLLPPVLSDSYTGRVLDDSEQSDLRKTLRVNESVVLEPSQYRPTGAPFASKSTPRAVGQRTNPLTGKTETRVFPKTYGCDGGIDYGDIFTLRSGTAAYYDKTIESGTVFLSGPRSGCTNSIIPSGGLLHVPYFYEGCTCSYPLPTAMSLVAMPERHEQWSAWGEMEIAPGMLQRVGINFGAPGDRMTREGTLWLDYPAVGGPSPKINIETDGNVQYFYHHSLWMDEDDSHPWVTASRVEGLERLVVCELQPGEYQVRLYFAEADSAVRESPSERLLGIRLQGRVVANRFDIVEQAGGTMKGIVKTFGGIQVENDLTLELTSSNGRTVISGIEIIRQ